MKTRPTQDEKILTRRVDENKSYDTMCDPQSGMTDAETKDSRSQEDLSLSINALQITPR